MAAFPFVSITMLVVAAAVMMVMAMAAFMALAGRFTAGQIAGEEALDEQLRRLCISAGENLDPRCGKLAVCALADPAGNHDIDALAEQRVDRAAAFLLRRRYQRAGIQNAARGGVGINDGEARGSAEVGE